MKDRAELIADILMGAAYADNKLDGKEKTAVEEILVKITENNPLTPELKARLDGFENKNFNAAAAVADLNLTEEQDKRRLLELISAVTEADGELDMDENAYLVSLGEQMQLPRNTFGDLAVEIEEVEDIAIAGKKLIKPPPVPGSR